MPDLLPPTAPAPSPAPPTPPRPGATRARGAQAPAPAASARKAQGPAAGAATFADLLASVATPEAGELARAALRTGAAAPADPSNAPPGQGEHAPAHRAATASPAHEGIPLTICVAPVVLPPQDDAEGEAFEPVVELAARVPTDQCEAPSSGSGVPDRVEGDVTLPPGEPQAAIDPLATAVSAQPSIPAAGTAPVGDVPIDPWTPPVTTMPAAEIEPDAAPVRAAAVPAPAPQAGAAHASDPAAVGPDLIDADLIDAPLPPAATGRADATKRAAAAVDAPPERSAPSADPVPGLGPERREPDDAVPERPAAAPAGPRPQGAVPGDATRAESRRAARAALRTAIEHETAAPSPVPSAASAEMPAATASPTVRASVAGVAAEPTETSPGGARVRTPNAVAAAGGDTARDAVQFDAGAGAPNASDGHATPSRDGRSSGEAYSLPHARAGGPRAVDSQVLSGAVHAQAAEAWMSRLAEAVHAPAAEPGALTTASAEAWGVPDQIVRGLQLQVREGTGEAVIRLRPEHLGEIVVEMKVEQDGVVATLKSDTPAVRAWIAAHRDDLEAGLADAGLRLDELRVSDREAGQERREREPQEDAPKRRARRAPEGGARFEILA